MDGSVAVFRSSSLWSTDVIYDPQQLRDRVEAVCVNHADFIQEEALHLKKDTDLLVVDLGEIEIALELAVELPQVVDRGRTDVCPRDLNVGCGYARWGRSGGLDPVNEAEEVDR